MTLAQFAKKHKMSGSLIGRRLSLGKTLIESVKPTKEPKVIEYNGKCMTVNQWAKILNINPVTLHNRITRWGVKLAFITPFNHTSSRIRTNEQHLGSAEFVKPV